ncbi:chorismate mutase [Actinopolymorpha alba]|uniref:chorismate mutase n=1 Tax=Actinopolymorpha alba TaxID=533267 RepID=UPI00036D95D4|nr:chorismate mutase [Actinopolymorpha alba]
MSESTLAHPSIDALIRQAPPVSVPECRAAIDEVDAVLAALLEYRAALTSQVQRLKPVSGQAGRDPRREAEIVERMAAQAPRLGSERLRRIMLAVIEESLDLAEEGVPAGG